MTHSRILLPACLMVAALLASCSGRSVSRDRPEPPVPEPVTLEYWIDGSALPFWMGPGNDEGSCRRVKLGVFLNPQFRTMEIGAVTVGSPASPDSTTTMEDELGSHITALLEAAAVEVMVTVVSSWWVWDKPGPPKHLLIDWDILHNADAGTYDGNPAPELRYPDLVLDRWTQARNMIAKGIYGPIGDLLRTRVPDLLLAYPEDMWDATALGDGVYSLPGHMSTGLSYWAIRRDLRQDVGVDPVTTYRDLVEFAEALRDSGRMERPLLVGLNDDLLSSVMAYYDIRPVLWDRSAGNVYDRSYLLYQRGNDPAIRVLADTEDEEVTEAFDLYGRLVGGNLIDTHPPVAYSFVTRGGSTTRLVSGTPWASLKGDWACVYVRHEEVLNLETLRRKHPNTAYEVFTAIPGERPPAPDHTSRHGLFIPSRGPSKTRVVQLLNTLHTREAYDLLQYGVEGSYWREESDGSYTPTPGGAAQTAYLPQLTFLRALTPFPYLERRYSGFEGEQAMLLHQMVRKAPLDGAAPPRAGAYQWIPDLSAVAEAFEEYRLNHHAVYRNLVRRGVTRGSEWEALLEASRETVIPLQRVLQRQVESQWAAE